MSGDGYILAALLLFSTTAIPVRAEQPSSLPIARSNLCSSNLTAPTDADNALVSDNYATAERLFRVELTSNPNSEDSHLGLIRALTLENKVAKAQAESASWLVQSPSSALAEVAAGEIAYREADIASAQDHANKAITDSHCEGRSLAFAADISLLAGLYAREINLINLAHLLRPNDELIRRSWIFSLPLPDRTNALTQYLSETQNLSVSDRESYATEVERLNLRQPGDCRITSQFTTTQLPLKRFTNEGTDFYALNTSFNGLPRRLEVDSGASGIVLTLATAKKLGLHPEVQLHSVGVGGKGRVDSYLTHVAKIRVGDLELSNCLVEVLEKSHLNADGLIGINLFANWLVTLDYPNSELLLAPLPHRPDVDPTTIADSEYQPLDRYIAPEMQNWLHILRVGHMLLLPARLDQGPMHYVIADTGSSQTTLSLSLATESHRAYVDPDNHFWGISGDIQQVYRVDHATLRFGAFQLPPASYNAFDLGNILHYTGLEVSGLIGLPTLSRMTISIDYRDNLMQLTYNPKYAVSRF